MTLLWHYYRCLRCQNKLEFPFLFNGVCDGNNIICMLLKIEVFIIIIIIIIIITFYTLLHLLLLLLLLWLTTNYININISNIINKTIINTIITLYNLNELNYFITLKGT